MHKSRFILWFIAVLTVFAAVIDLPKQLPVNFSIGGLKINRIIKSPRWKIDLGPIKIDKTFENVFGLDLSGGTHLVLEADMANIDPSARDAAFDSAKGIVETRVNLFGLTEPVVQQSKVGNSYRIIVEIPGVTDVSSAIDLIGTTAQLQFRQESSESAKIATPSSYFEIWPVETSLSGKNLKKSEVVFDPNSGQPQVSLEFDSQGAKIFYDITKENSGKTLAIFLDDQLLSAPRVNEPIEGGRAVIQGSFNLAQAKELSVMLNAGALPVPLKLIQQRNIGATLGQQSINQSIVAGLIGFAIIGIFMVFSYGFLGLVANFALVIYALVVFAVFKIVPVTLTMAGIAGFILSVGMAVDANILIFERMKEELRWGKDYLHAVNLGFDRAFPSIRDSNISSLITCAILYWFGTGIVRGFAITLAIGIIVSLFTAVTVTRTFIRMIYVKDK